MFENNTKSNGNQSKNVKDQNTNRIPNLDSNLKRISQKKKVMIIRDSIIKHFRHENLS